VELIVVLNNVTSVQRLLDFSRVALTSGEVKYLVLTKVGGTAAQAGVPEVHKQAFRSSKGLLVLPELRDAIEILSPEAVYMISSTGKNELNGEELLRAKRVMVVFSGVEPGFSKLEESLGLHVKLPGVNDDIGPSSLLSVFLYCTLRRFDLKGG
jgi:SpoU rRNA methylase family enzyme